MVGLSENHGVHKEFLGYFKFKFGLINTPERRYLNFAVLDM